jgi:hypothetical protein
MGLSMLHAMSIQRHKVSSRPLPPPFSVLLCLHNKSGFKKISRQIQNMLSQYERSSPLHPIPFVVWVARWLRSWLWDKVSYSQLEHRVPYPTSRFYLNTASAFGREIQWKSDIPGKYCFKDLHRCTLYKKQLRILQALPPPPIFDTLLKIHRISLGVRLFLAHNTLDRM